MINNIFSILIVSNQPDLIVMSLKKLSVHENTRYEIVLVIDGVRNQIDSDSLFLKVIYFNQNYGFPAAVNLGVKCCTSDWILLLNDDCVLDENFFAKLEKELQAPKYEIYSFKILQGDKKNDQKIIYACGDAIDQKGLAKNVGKGERDTGQYDDLSEVDLACFACILIKKKWLEKFPLDENYFGYYEDVDFCLNLKEIGIKIGFLPHCKAYHLGEASFSKFDKIENEMRQFRNLSLTYFKHFPVVDIVRHWLIFNLKSFRYYFFMKKKSGFLKIELYLLWKFLGAIWSKF